MIPGADSNWESQLRRGVVEYCVLAALRSRERYGFELARSLGAPGGLLMGEGTVYPLLARLRQRRWVETTWRESGDGPPRRYYRLTEQGAQALEAFEWGWIQFRTAVDRALEEGG